MYMFIGDKSLIKDKGKASTEIGISFANFSRILNRRMACRKVVAYCIVKYIDSEAEIQDFFEKVK